MIATTTPMITMPQLESFHKSCSKCGSPNFACNAVGSYPKSLVATPRRESSSLSCGALKNFESIQFAKGKKRDTQIGNGNQEDDGRSGGIQRLERLVALRAFERRRSVLMALSSTSWFAQV